MLVFCLWSNMVDVRPSIVGYIAHLEFGCVCGAVCFLFNTQRLMVWASGARWRRKSSPPQQDAIAEAWTKDFSVLEQTLPLSYSVIHLITAFLPTLSLCQMMACFSTMFRLHKNILLKFSPLLKELWNSYPCKTKSCLLAQGRCINGRSDVVQISGYNSTFGWFKYTMYP